MKKIFISDKLATDGINYLKELPLSNIPIVPADDWRTAITMTWEKYCRDRVIEYFQKKLQNSPKDYRYHYWIGRAYQLSLQISTAQKWLEDGLVIAQQTIEANPRDAQALSFVGLFHSRLGNFSDGERAMNKAMEINNDSADILFRSAELYSIQRDGQKAFSALEKALHRKYDFAELLNADFSFIAGEPEFLPAVTRKIDDKWPLK